jgi:drug/metabolite transporter (DMT)-like permease
VKGTWSWLGIALAVLSAVTFSGTSITAGVSLQGGANAMSVVTIRFFGAIMVLYGLLRFSGVSLRLAPRDRNIALALGILQAAQSYFLYTSFVHIPVGLTMIIFYVYPLLIAILSAMMGLERLTWPMGAGLLVAFIGLVLVFDVTAEGFSLTGARFAVIAAVLWSVLVVLVARYIQSSDTRPVTLHIQGSAALIFVAILAISGGLQVPDTVRGWTGFILLPVFYAIAITSFFAAAQIIGSVRTSLIMNSEPVLTVILGILILGEVLTTPQLVGGALVLLALLAAKWSGRKHPPEPD